MKILSPAKVMQMNKVYLTEGHNAFKDPNASMTEMSSLNDSETNKSSITKSKRGGFGYMRQNSILSSRSLFSNFSKVNPTGSSTKKKVGFERDYAINEDEEYASLDEIDIEEKKEFDDMNRKTRRTD